LPLALLAASIAGLLMMSNLLVALFPLEIQVSGDGSELAVSVDGRTEYISTTTPIRSLRVLPADPYRREYQIDGSDSTNNQNLDSAYFTQFSQTPYYRFQAWLRDEGSYSLWRDLEIRDGDGSELLHLPSPAADVEIPLPEPFSLTVRLQRPEAPRTLELMDQDGNLLRLEINRNDRHMLVTYLTPDAAPRQLSSPFLPRQWPPFLAGLLYLLLRVAALALSLPLLLLLPAALAARVPFRMLGLWGYRSLVVVAVATSLALALFSGTMLFDRSPHILDAVSYYFQGKVLAAGALAAPAPAVGGAFPTPFTVVHDGLWFSQYPPGVPVLLAVGFLVGLPWLVEPLLAAGSVLLVYLAGRSQYGRGTALIAALLMAGSPFLGLLAGSYMSHVPTTFFAAGFLYAATRYLQRPGPLWAAFAASALGATFLCRETAALLWGLPMALFLLLGIRRKGVGGWPRDLAVAGGCLSLFGVLYLLYNWGLTGSPLLMPRGLFFGGDRFGFGEGVGFYGEHTLAAGLMNAEEQLTSLAICLFGWPFFFALAIPMLPFLTGRANRWDRLHGAVIALFVLTFVGYFYHGIVMGPRYYFETLPCLVLLTARGFVALTETMDALLFRLSSHRLAGLNSSASGTAGARWATLLLAALLFACSALYYWPRQGELYQGYNGWPGGGGPTLGGFVGRDLGGRVPELKGALVTTDDWWVYSVYLAPMNSPRLDGDVVFALLREGESAEELQAAFPGRAWLRLVKDRNDVLNPQ
jgi:hypothetical protein